MTETRKTYTFDKAMRRIEELEEQLEGMQDLQAKLLRQNERLVAKGDEAFADLRQVSNENVRESLALLVPLQTKIDALERKVNGVTPLADQWRAEAAKLHPSQDGRSPSWLMELAANLEDALEDNEPIPSPAPAVSEVAWVCQFCDSGMGVDDDVCSVCEALAPVPEEKP